MRYSTGSCLLPRVTSNMNIKVLKCKDVVDVNSDEVPDPCQILITCESGFAFEHMKPDTMLSTCHEGNWIPPLRDCKSMLN